MRDLLLGFMLMGGLFAGLFSAELSVLVLNWIWFQRPYDFSWGAWTTWPWFQLALLVAILSNLFRGKLRPRMNSLLFVYLLIMCVVTMSTLMAFNGARAMRLYTTFAPSMWLGPILIFAIVSDLGLLKKVIWVVVGGVGINACKTGAVLTLAGGGHLTDQISGFVGDNNVFGLVLCLVVAMLIGLRKTIPDRRLVIYGFYSAIVLIAMCIIYTQSRGALISLGIIFLVSNVLSGKKFKGALIATVVLTAGYMLIPAENFERMGTLRNIESDDSAMGRVENWRLSFQEAVRNPMFGVGPDNHIPYNRSLGVGVQVRVAHSVYFQVMGELGFLGFTLYMIFVFMAIGMLWRSWRYLKGVARQHPDLAWAEDLCFWTFCGYIGYSVGAGLLNMFYIEFPWYVVFYMSMLMPFVQKEIKSRSLVTQAGPTQIEKFS